MSTIQRLSAVTLLGSSIGDSVGAEAGLALLGAVRILLPGTISQIAPVTPTGLVSAVGQSGLGTAVPIGGARNGTVALINAAMQMERQANLGASPYERTLERRDHANGCKPKTVATRMGDGRASLYLPPRPQLPPVSPCLGEFREIIE